TFRANPSSRFPRRPNNSPSLLPLWRRLCSTWSSSAWSARPPANSATAFSHIIATWPFSTEARNCPRPGVDKPGHHIAIIEFVRAHIDKKHAGLLAVFDRLRRKRNMALYDDAGYVSRHDAEQALESAHDNLGVSRADITARKC